MTKQREDKHLQRLRILERIKNQPPEAVLSDEEGCLAYGPEGFSPDTLRRVRS